MEIIEHIKGLICLKAEQGKLIFPKAKDIDPTTGEELPQEGATEIYLGINDSPDNYEEREV